MKFRTMLLASAAVMFTSSAFAADITNPFFLPTTGKVLSDTSVEMSRLKIDDGFEDVEKSLKATEQVTVGLMDNLAVVGTIGNEFDVNEDYNNDHNFYYGLGVKYNHNFGRVLTQVGFSYNTFDPRSWYGKSGEGHEYNTNRWEKILSGEVKLGYDMGCDFTPYTSFTMNGNIDQADRDQEYSWFLGAHKAWMKMSADAGFRYDFGSSEYDEAWYVELAANYFVSDNVTVGAFGDYYLGGEGHKDVDYGYTFGLNAKVLF